jgi:hypothetical protein
MIHVVTVHHHSERWIDIQLTYLRKHVADPFEIWANIEGVEHRRGDFDHVVTALGEHPGKLNLLAMEVASVSPAGDLIMFLDGDAFPIADPMPVVRKGLEDADLVAVQRLENLSDPQPHPCFAVCTVGAWLDLHGDWSPGHAWPNPRWGTMTDTGGNLLRLLELRQKTWVPLLRTNHHDLHPLWYGIYGGIVYHHGAGFRSPISRRDAAGQPRDLLPRVANRNIAGAPVRTFNQRRSARWFRIKQQQAEAQSDAIYREIRGNPHFYERLQ